MVPFLREPIVQGKDEILGPLFRDMGVPEEPNFDEELAWVKAAHEAVVAGTPDYLSLIGSDPAKSFPGSDQGSRRRTNWREPRPPCRLRPWS
jgi:hypothetical protein